MDAARPRWPLIKDVLHRQALMDDMMERCGVDVLAVIRSDRVQSFAEARARCRLCLSERTCREWLLAPPGERVLPPDFCPNGSLFRLHLKQH